MSNTPKKAGGNYVNAPQYEMPIDGGFALIVETAIDGERIARAREESDRHRESAEKAQLPLF